MQAILTDYTSVNSGNPIETDIELVDPCSDPFSLTMPALNTPADYYYTEDDPILSFVTQ